MFWHVTSSRSQLGNTGERQKDRHWSEDTKTYPDFSSTSILRQVIANVRSLTGQKVDILKNTETGQVIKLPQTAKII